jgi:cytochrome c peroxidase
MKLRPAARLVATALLLAVTPADSDTAARTVFTGRDADGKVSLTPDGRFMAVTDWSSGDIAIREMATGKLKRLMAKPGGWESDDVGEYAVLSPDRKQAAYLWYEGGRDPHLRVIGTAAGSKPRILVRNPEFSYVIPAAWSPDGKSVLVHIWKVDYTAQIAWVSVADGSIRILRSLDWRRPVHPALSPDGRYIAYSALAGPDSTDSDVYVLSADGWTETEVVKAAGVNQAPVWTPDGSSILYTSDRSGTFDEWSVPVRDGKPAGEPVLIQAGIGRILPIGMAQSGAFYYVHEQGGEHVLLAGLDGNKIVGPVTALTDTAAGSNRAPSWSPDGKFVAFKRRNAGNRPGYDLVVRAVGSGEERIYAHDHLTGTITRPLWFPDGKTLLAAMSDNQQRVSFQRVDRQSGAFTEMLLPDSAYLATSALSPGGKTVYITVRDGGPKKSGGIAEYDLASGGYRQVLVVPGFVNNFALSPDGRTLAIARSVPRDGNWQGRLSLAGIDGTGLRDLYLPSAADEQDVFGGGPMVAWTQDGRSILFGAGSTEWRIMRVSAEGGPAEYTGLMTQGLQHDLSISPDGSRLAFGHGRYSVKEMRVLALASVPAVPGSTAKAPEQWHEPPLGLDAHRNVPESNPLTEASVALGEKLFFDTRLSRDQTISCASCHDPARAFTDGRAVARGVGGTEGKRNAPALVNRGYGASFFWDGRAATLEEQVIEPILNPLEMGMTRNEVERRTGTKMRDAAAALASYVRSIRSGDSRYDLYTMGQRDALSALEKQGLELFRGKGRCVTCHVGPNFTDEQFHNTGAAWKNGKPADEGRFGVSANPRDLGSFKTPTLREAARTAPYMHDGSLATLEDVVEFYSSGGRANPRLDQEIRPRNFNAEEMRALVAFLRSLNGTITAGSR